MPEFYGYESSLSGQLQHHGVKGMHWGARKKKGEKHEHVGLMENARRNKSASDDFYKQKSADLVAHAKKNPEHLIFARTETAPNGVVMTGKQFHAQVKSGIAFDARSSHVYATLEKDPDGKKRYKRQVNPTYKMRNFNKQ